jgi:hypothetical protein
MWRCNNYERCFLEQEKLLIKIEIFVLGVLMEISHFILFFITERDFKSDCDKTQD